MTNINESLLTLSHLATQIKYQTEIVKVTYENATYLNKLKLTGWYANKPYRDSVLAIVLNSINIMACSYLDELLRELTPIKYPENSETIMNFLKKVNPAIRRIKKWTNLKDYRNHMLVHNYRIKNISIFADSHKIIEYNAPTKDNEILLLAELIFLINSQLFEFFPNEVTKILTTQVKVTDRYKFQNNQIDFKEELNSIEMEIKNFIV